jgi:uncharacterized protein YecA (UPF0149 family)
MSESSRKRNDLCHCSSGLKYKNCHLLQEQKELAEEAHNYRLEKRIKLERAKNMDFEGVKDSELCLCGSGRQFKSCHKTFYSLRRQISELKSQLEYYDSRQNISSGFDLAHNGLNAAPRVMEQIKTIREQKNKKKTG